MISNWIFVIRCGNLPKGEKSDLVSKWLIITRACVFSMTLISVLIGGLLSAIDDRINWLSLLLVAIGLLLSHATNNMVNDLFDYLLGVDTDDYPRANYSPHPILSGMVSINKLVLAIFICLLMDLLIAIYLTYIYSWTIMIFAVIGLLTSIFYVAPPFKLKQRGLGEFAIFLIWGPLMIGGTYFAVSGRLTYEPFLASIPYGLAVTSVVMGKHLDKIEKDRKKNIKSLPVVLGEQNARLLTQIIVLSFYLIVVYLSAKEIIPIFSLIALLSLPQGIRFLTILSNSIPSTTIEAFEIAKDVIPKDLKEKFDPKMPPEEVPLWPLWYVIWGVWWTRIAGGLFVVGLLIQFLLQFMFKN